MTKTRIGNSILSIDSSSWHYFSLRKSCLSSMWCVPSNLSLNESGDTKSSFKKTNLLCVNSKNESDWDIHPISKEIYNVVHVKPVFFMTSYILSYIWSLRTVQYYLTGFMLYECTQCSWYCVQSYHINPIKCIQWIQGCKPIHYRNVQAV